MPEDGDVVDDLDGRKLSPFAGLRALCDLDLQLLRRPQVSGGHAEPGGRDLPDRASGSTLGALERFAALTAIAPATEPVHRRRERLVRFGGEGADGHCRAE